MRMFIDRLGCPHTDKLPNINTSETFIKETIYTKKSVIIFSPFNCILYVVEHKRRSYEDHFPSPPMQLH